MTGADLHTHTTASDGQLTPEELVRLANQFHLDAVAITDHDTTAAIEPARIAADSSLQVIPGIEIGARSSEEKVDILGYLIDPRHPELQQRLAHFRSSRLQRGQMIVERLAQIGAPVDWARVTALAGGDTVGRPHIARALVEAGQVASIKEAFDRYIGSGCPAYVPRATISPEEAIRLIHAAGGAAVLAHPVYVRGLPSMVARLAAAGLDGIEVAYPDHTPEIEACARQLAHQFDLVMTGGSDFHGFGVDGKAMLGAALAPPGCVEALRERAGQYQHAR